MSVVVMHYIQVSCTLGYPILVHTIPHSVILGTRNWNGPTSLLHCYMLTVVLIRCCLASY